MKINILFFGAIADAVGSRETSVDLSGKPDVGTAVDLVMRKHPALENRKLLFSVNEEYAELGTFISDGDEVAIFTPVSGG